MDIQDMDTHMDTHMDIHMDTHMDIQAMDTHMDIQITNATMYTIMATPTALDRRRSCKVGPLCGRSSPSSLKSSSLYNLFLRSLPTHPGRHVGQYRSHHLLHSYSEFW